MNDIEELKWDSDFFGKKIGKITVQNNDELTNIKLNKYDLIYVFSDNSNLNYKLVDKKIVYIIDDLNTIENNNTLELTTFDKNIDDYNQLLDLTLQSGEFSRFKLDKNFSNGEYEKLYTEWINKSINKELAFDIIIKRLDNKVVGFSTLSKKTNELADISLVAVDSNYRGRGIAKQLIQQCIHLSKEKGFKKIQVVTQLDNNPANILYTHCGFKKDSLTYIYHIWNNDTI